jgi:hypothetical protein
MSGAKEPDYIRRRNDREKQAKKAARAERDAKERDDHTAALNTLVERYAAIAAKNKQPNQKNLRLIGLQPWPRSSPPSSPLVA